MSSQNKQSSSRREFLKTSGATVAAASAMALTGVARGGVHVFGSDTIRVGLIGCGGRGTGAAVQAMNTQSGNVELAAVGDVFESRTKQAIKACRESHEAKVTLTDDSIFTGFDAYKKVLASNVNLVILATPPGFRPLQFEAAIDAGKHVFMEKPVAVDAPGVRRILQATEKAKQKGLAVGVGLQRRHERLYRETIGAIQEGIIGDPVLAQAYWNQGSLWVVKKDEKESELQHQIRNWLYFAWLSGDHIVEQHIHNLDVINWANDSFPVKAQGMGGRQVRTGAGHGEIFDHHAVEYTYANGLVMSSQCRQIPDCWNAVSEHLYGTKGYCDISAGRIVDRTGKELYKATGSRDGHQQEHHDLFADLRNGIIPNEGEFGAKSTMTAIMGRLATYTGREITWDQALASNIKLADFDSFKSLADEAPVKRNENGEYDFPLPGKDFNKYIDW
ncbi:MAG: Gfo/Idh/MocA family oxidoreductase [Pirellulaceae bacterium]